MLKVKEKDIFFYMPKATEKQSFDASIKVIIKVRTYY